jgi:hypothetical protein
MTIEFGPDCLICGEPVPLKPANKRGVQRLVHEGDCKRTRQAQVRDEYESPVFETREPLRELLVTSFIRNCDVMPPAWRENPEAYAE